MEKKNKIKIMVNGKQTIINSNFSLKNLVDKLELPLNKIAIEVNKTQSDPVIILSGKNWHEGVIGIVASRLKDKFNKPVIIITVDKNLGKASARSIIGFDIGSVIIAAMQEKILIKGGGHKMAGGFTIDVNNIEKFKDFVLKKLNK